MQGMTVSLALRLLESGEFEDPQLEAWNRAMDATESEHRRFWLAVWHSYNFERWAPPQALVTVPGDPVVLPTSALMREMAQLQDVALEMIARR